MYYDDVNNNNTWSLIVLGTQQSLMFSMDFPPFMEPSRLDDPYSKIGIDDRFSSSPDRPFRLWGPPIPLLNGHCGSFLGQRVKLTAVFLLAPRLTMSGVIPPRSLCPLGVDRDSSTFLWKLKVYYHKEYIRPSE
jgi:hypothetical protein